MTLILLHSWLFTSKELKMVNFKGDYKRHFNEKGLCTLARLLSNLEGTHIFLQGERRENYIRSLLLIHASTNSIPALFE